MPKCKEKAALVRLGMSWAQFIEWVESQQSKPTNSYQHIAET